ncbi:hypothetical protein Asp14428_74860 [Actinoplanes sp. NBRC 14428]|nr:hypothetical protein Asp14428_74860 [Actinoplanes sp. NBRC 14428]
MTRQNHVRTGTSAPRRPAATGAGRRPPAGVEALLELQRQAGNAAVGQVLGREPHVVQRTAAPPGAWPGTEHDYDAPDAGTVAEALRRHLEEQPETAVEVAPPSPVSTVGKFETALSRTPSEPQEDSREPSEREPSERASTDSDDTFVTAPLPRPRLDGDLAKAAGAGVATAVPLLGMANTAGPAPKLVAAGTGTAGATAVGDAVSEVVKWLRTGSINLPKFFGGVVTAGGLGVNAAGIATGLDPLRYTGFALQSAGLGGKAAGEAYRWEDGGADLAAVPDGDIAKAAGAFVASAAPLLQAAALATQRRLEAQIAAGRGTGPVPPLPAAVAAALLAGGTAGGEFASEVVKGVRDGRVNVPKLIGGLLGMTGAGIMAGGVATGSPAARYVALAFTELGLASKALGEARKWENDPMGDAGSWPLTEARRRRAQGSGEAGA